MKSVAYAALSDCTRLRHHSLSQADYLEDSLLEKVIRTAPGLETLHLLSTLCRNLAAPEITMKTIWNGEYMSSMYIHHSSNT